MTLENAIRDLLGRYRKAIHDKDAQAVASLSTSDGTAFSMAPPLAMEGPPDPAGLQLWFDTWDGPIEQDTPDWRIVAGEDTAFAFGLTRIRGRKVGGEPVEMWFRQTLGLTRIDDVWRVHHVHDSVPFAMDGSHRALVDLDPQSTIDRKAAVGAAE